MLRHYTVGPKTEIENCSPNKSPSPCGRGRGGGVTLKVNCSPSPQPYLFPKKSSTFRGPLPPIKGEGIVLEFLNRDLGVGRILFRGVI